MRTGFGHFEPELSTGQPGNLTEWSDVGAQWPDLDDINARGADHATGAPAGLEELTQIDWPPGTVFTRAQLEAARDGHPYAEE